MSVDGTVLVVEDDEDDFFLTERVLRRHTSGQIFRVESGRAAIDYLSGEGNFADRKRYPLPQIMFLDLKMDQGGGHEVLAAVKQNPPLLMPRIFVLTGSNEPKDRELVKNSGVAAGYIVKPLAGEHLTSIFGPPPR